MALEIDSRQITGSMNVNVTTDGESDVACTVRIATSDIIQGNLPPGTTVYVDVDVFTGEKGFGTKDQNFVKQWIEKAHTKEKSQFFQLLTSETIESLREK